MTERIVECVPNFSEGRRAGVIERLVGAIEGVARVAVLGVHRDEDHNRSVITFAGHPEGIAEAAVRAVAIAAELIDVSRHDGVHPRLGAADVVPFVPVRGVTMDECVALAHRAGARVARELGLPVYFYERAALRPERAALEMVRRGGYEQLREEIGRSPEAAPDLGPARLHETAGACIIGARPFLIAYNVNLRTTEVTLARRIARAVRARDGGLPATKALGFELRGRGLVQVSMNLLDYQLTSPAQAFAAVEREARALGVEIAGSEIVGLVPQAALPPGDPARLLRLENFSPDLILENRLRAAFAVKDEERA